MPAQGSTGVGVGTGYTVGGTQGYGAQATTGYQGSQTTFGSQSLGGSTTGTAIGVGGIPPGTYGAQASTTGYNGAGAYGGNANAGLYGQQQQGYLNGASSSTFGSRTTGSIPGTTGAMGSKYATTRSESDGSVRDCISAIVYASLLSLVIFPIDLI